MYDCQQNKNKQIPVSNHINLARFKSWRQIQILWNKATIRRRQILFNKYCITCTLLYWRKKLKDNKYRQIASLMYYLSLFEIKLPDFNRKFTRQWDFKLVIWTKSQFIIAAFSSTMKRELWSWLPPCSSPQLSHSEFTLSISHSFLCIGRYIKIYMILFKK